MMLPAVIRTPRPDELLAWAMECERVIERMVIEAKLHVVLSRVVKGPRTVTFVYRLAEFTRLAITTFAGLDKAFGHALRTPVRVDTSHPGKGILVELDRPDPQTPDIERLVNASSGLRVAIGLDSQNRPMTIDFAEIPHLLVVGPTGRGKSQAIRSLLYTLATHNDARQVRFAVHALKRDDWEAFSCLPHFMDSDITSSKTPLHIAETVLPARGRLHRYECTPHLFVVIDDIGVLHGAAKLAGDIANAGRGVNIHLIVGAQLTGRGGGLSQSIEQNARARLVFGGGDKGAEARHLGVGGTSLGRQRPGDAIANVDGVLYRVATAMVDDARVRALLPKRAPAKILTFPKPAPALPAPQVSPDEPEAEPEKESKPVEPAGVTFPLVSTDTPDDETLRAIGALFIKNGKRTNQTLREVFGGPNGRKSPKTLAILSQAEKLAGG